jgi:hypothetical protein
MTWPTPAALRPTPSRGQRWWPGEAGSTAFWVKPPAHRLLAQSFKESLS